MQDIHSIGGGGGSGGGGGPRLFTDRRLRPNNNPNHQALKCPRCESLNTKFCYYNNYNLSQPRHFCKSCRRYWTKGGVLRNVPVGGGCRKTKRSKSKKCDGGDLDQLKSNNSHSSSDNTSTLTANTTTTTEVVSASNNSSDLLSFFNFQQNGITNPSFDHPPLIDQSLNGGIFSHIGGFTNLMTSSNDPYNMKQNNQEAVVQNNTQNELKMVEEISGGFLDQTVQVEFSGLQNRISNGGLEAHDWRGGAELDDKEFFYLTGAVDQAYWSQTQWNDHDHDHSLNYLP